MKQIELLTPADMLHRLYETADEETKEEMRERFPDMEFRTAYQFTEGECELINRSSMPFLVALGLAPEKSYVRRCLRVNNTHEAKVFEVNGLQFIEFVKK